MSTATAVTTWNIDPAHTVAEFKVKHMMISNVKGQFTKVTGSLTLDEADLSKSSVEATIEIGSIATGDAGRDGHLQSAEFFDAATYPTMTFKSTSVKAGAVTGDLTIKGVTKPVTIDFESTGTATDPYGNLRAGFEGRTVINRKDWGVSFNAPLEAGGVLVSDKVTLEFDISAIRV